MPVFLARLDPLSQQLSAALKHDRRLSVVKHREANRRRSSVLKSAADEAAGDAGGGGLIAQLRRRRGEPAESLVTNPFMNRLLNKKATEKDAHDIISRLVRS